MQIHVLSPYPKQFAYPSFWKLLARLSAEHTIYNPVEGAKGGLLQRAYNSKLKHLMPLLASLWNIVKTRRSPDVFITFGTYQIGFVFLLRLLFPRAKLITYQPELFEFDAPLLTNVFRASAHRYDLFLDVEPMRLKLRRRYNRKMRAARATVLPNFDHKLEQVERTGERNGCVVYAGVIDSEKSLVRMCSEYEVRNEDVDCYVTKYLDQQPPTQLRSLEPRPFHLIAKQGYCFGLICYPFSNGSRGALNNKYCAPSKLFSYLAYGILPVHYPHPTLKGFVKAGLSTDRFRPHTHQAQADREAIRTLFDEMSAQVASATDAIIETIERPHTAVQALHRIGRS